MRMVGYFQTQNKLKYDIVCFVKSDAFSLTWPILTCYANLHLPIHETVKGTWKELNLHML